MGGIPNEIGLRPDWFRMAAPSEEPMVRCKVDLAEQLGDETLVYTGLATGETLVLKIGGQHLLRKGDTLDLVMETDHPIVFDDDGTNLFLEDRNTATA